jgi:hypothetical protein
MQTIQAVRYDSSRRRFAIKWSDLCARHPSTYVKYVHYKPKGVWFSVGDAWKHWSKDNLSYKTKYAHQVQFDRQDLICIETPHDLNVFERKFGVKQNKDMPCPLLIDWKRVTIAYPTKIGVLLLTGSFVRDLPIERVMEQSYWMRIWDVDSIVVYGLACKK